MMGLAGRYDVMPSPVDETEVQARLRARMHLESSPAVLTPSDYTRVLAEEKAKALALALVSSLSRHPVLVLGSDTIVADQQDNILEKPRDGDEAVAMLTALAGTSHTVHTGVALYRIRNSDAATSPTVDLVSSFTASAQVRFAPFSSLDIKSYVDTGEPMDKAGAYGIQGIGGQLVESVKGDFFTVRSIRWEQGLTMRLSHPTLVFPR
jgi:septum formation protein